MGGQSGTAFAGQINLKALGAELPCDTCVQVDMHSTGRGGCACSTLTLIPGRNLLLLIIPCMVYLRRIVRCGDVIYAMLWLCGGLGVHDEHFLFTFYGIRPSKRVLL